MKLNQSILAAIVDEHYANLYRFALSLTGNEAEAADLTQQTYYRLATKGGQIREAKTVKSWLFTTLRREFLDLRRRTGRFTPIDDRDEAEPELEMPTPFATEAVRAADVSLVVEALGEVREVFREALTLFYLEDLSYREIAEVLDVPIGTVMSRLSRGKRDLRAKLAENLNQAEQPDNVVSLKKAQND